MRARILSIVSLAAILLVYTGAASGQPHQMGTAFTYQGKLTDGGSSANGPYDFEFKLCDDPVAACQVAGTTVADYVDDHPVDDGLFTVEVDFGQNVFNGEARWLELGVRPGASSGGDPYTPLADRQRLTPTPHALALPGLWTQPGGAPNLIGGYAGNEMGPGVGGATISGGGEEGSENRITDEFCTVGGGAANRAGDDAGTAIDAMSATVGGGIGNVASGGSSTVAGGEANLAQGPRAVVGGGLGNRAYDYYCTISGGWGNYSGTDDGDPHGAASATVGGGENNAAAAAYATISGGGGVNWDAPTCDGGDNHGALCGGCSSDPLNLPCGGPEDCPDPQTETCDPTPSYCTGGGECATNGVGNHVYDNHGTIGGGATNRAGTAGPDMGDAPYATVGGGVKNTASGDTSVVGGGHANVASGLWSCVGGGTGNDAAERGATVGGGEGNAAYGSWATVPGGSSNMADGMYGFAAGQRASAIHTGTFVWSDSTTSDPSYFESTGANQFLIKATNGVGIGTNNPQQQLDVDGTVQMTGFKLTTSPADGYVLTSDASGVGTWQAAGAGSGYWTANGNHIYSNNTENVGIGVTLPGGAKLRVEASAGDAVWGWAKALSGVNYAVRGETLSGTDDAAGVYGVANSPTGKLYGVHGRIESATNGAAGVFGHSTNTSGETYGVSGKTASTAAHAAGVYGEHWANTGEAYGVFGRTYSTTANAAGVYGEADAGWTSGVMGLNWSTGTNAAGVTGAAFASSGGTYGVKGYSNSSSGAGVWGWATSASGVTEGVAGTNDSTSDDARGVYGHAKGATGKTRGVYGQTDSTTGGACGVMGYALETTGDTYGVAGESESSIGKGVWAHAAHTSGVNYALYAVTSSSSGYAGYFVGGRNYFQGDVGIGRTPATNELEVEGDASKTSAGDWLANSDRRIKTDITRVPNALETIDRLRPVQFKYTEDYRGKHPSIEDKQYLNFVAQEYQEVFPDFVKDSGEDGLLQIDTHPASIYAVAAVQELHKIVKQKDAQIATQQQQIAELAARLTALEKLTKQADAEQEGGGR